MVVKIDAMDLSDEIRKQVEEYGVAIRRSLNDKVQEVAAWSANELRKGGPYNEKSGTYSKDWDYKLRNRSFSSVTMTEEYSIYNKKHYQLTHLLEKGHLKRNGSDRVRAFEHIKPVEQMAEELMISKVGEAVREANNA